MAKHNISIKQGSTFKMKVTLKTDAGFVPIQDYEFSGTIKNSIYDEVGYPFTFQKIDEVNGAFLVLLEDDVSRQMDFTHGVYNIYYTIDGQEDFRLLEGEVEISLGVY